MTGRGRSCQASLAREGSRSATLSDDGVTEERRRNEEGREEPIWRGKMMQECRSLHLPTSLGAKKSSGGSLRKGRIDFTIDARRMDP